MPRPPPAPITPTLSKDDILAFLMTFNGVATASQTTAVSNRLSFIIY